MLKLLAIPFYLVHIKIVLCLWDTIFFPEHRKLCCVLVVSVMFLANTNQVVEMRGTCLCYHRFMMS